MTRLTPSRTVADVTEILVLVNGLPGSGKTTLAHQLGRALDAPMISKDAIKEALAQAVTPPLPSGALGAAAMEAAWVLAASVPGTVVVESWWFASRDLRFVEAGIATAAPARVVEIWCDPGVDVARERYARRDRDALHEDVGRLERDWERWAAEGRPLGVGPVVSVDTSITVDVKNVAVAILAARQNQP